MSTTSKGFRYPGSPSTTAPNIPQDIQNLATDVDGYFNGVVAALTPASGGWQNYRAVNGGGFQLLQIVRLGNLRILGGVISNNVSYSAQSGFATLASTDWPTHDVMGIGITPGMAVRVDINAAGSCSITPFGTVAANVYHGFQIAYNVNNS